MSYTILGSVLFFVVAVLTAFLLGYRFLHGKVEALIDSWEKIRDEEARENLQRWDRLWVRLQLISETHEAHFSGVNERLEKVSAAISSHSKPEPINFSKIEKRLEGLRESIGNIPIPLTPKETLLQPVMARLDAIESAIDTVAKSGIQKDIDLTPLISKFAALEAKLSAASRYQKVDLTPLDKRLKAIESRLVDLVPRPEAQAKVESPQRHTDRSAPRILSAALFGRPDDLKLISGVGHKIEEILNENGVYYYWQVAEWSPQDIDAMDERLAQFKGRVTREDWVSQARRLKQNPDAAKRPTD